MVSSQLAMCYLLFIIFTDNFIHIHKRPAIGTMARDCIFKYHMDGVTCPHVCVCVCVVCVVCMCVCGVCVCVHVCV